MEEWVDERIEEVNDVDLLSRKVDDGCFEPNEVLQALEVYGSETSSKFVSDSKGDGGDQKEDDFQLCNLFKEQGTVENGEAEVASEAMDHVSDTIIQDLTAPSSERGNIASQILSSLRNGVGGSQS